MLVIFMLIIFHGARNFPTFFKLLRRKITKTVENYVHENYEHGNVMCLARKRKCVSPEERNYSSQEFFAKKQVFGPDFKSPLYLLSIVLIFDCIVIAKNK